MRSESQTMLNKTRLNKIKKISGILRNICKFLMTMIALGFLAGSVALVINRGGTIRYFNVGILIGELTLRARFIVLALTALMSGVMFKCFFHLHQLLGNYSRAEIFTAGSARQIRQLGITCMLWGGLNVLSGFLPLAMSAPAPKSFEGNFDFVGIGLIIFVISWFMEMAAELHEENELTI